jgi:hypothetical protein
MDPDKPSSYMLEPWLWARSPLDRGVRGAGGKWLLYVGATYVDDVWAKVKACTESGVLGCTVRERRSGACIILVARAKRRVLWRPILPAGQGGDTAVQRREPHARDLRVHTRGTGPR